MMLRTLALVLLIVAGMGCALQSTPPATPSAPQAETGHSGRSGAAAPKARTWTWQTDANWAYTTFQDGKYVLRNNIWGAGTPQRMMANSEREWRVEARHVNGHGNVKAYPQLIRGWADGDPTRSGYLTPRARNGMGIEVDAIRKADIYWKMKAPRSGRYMALWDIYLHHTPDPTGSREGSINILLFQRTYDPEGETGWGVAREALSYPAVTVDGRELRIKANVKDEQGGIVVWVGPHAETESGVEEMRFDLKALIHYLLDQGQIPGKGMYLTSIQAGWEIIDGGVFETNGLWTALQDEPNGGVPAALKPDADPWPQAGRHPSIP